MIVSLGIFNVLQVRRIRIRVAAWVDRRFFREAYDAELLLSDLGERVRTFLDTPRPLETVAGCIAASLHVSHLAVRLKGPEPFQPVTVFFPVAPGRPL